MKRWLILCVCSYVFALDQQPWFGEFLEFDFHSAYLWRHYSNVDNGYNPTKYSSTDQMLDVEFANSLTKWNMQLGMNFADTEKHDWSYLSTAGYLRYLILDDVAGDSVSWTVGTLVRSVNGHMLDDVSIPYHAHLNFEFITALGKEWSHLYAWLMRSYAVLGAGIGNRGAPYLLGELHFAGNFNDKHTLEIFADSLWGLGGRKDVNVQRFHSYANIGHHNIDLGALYRYHFDFWGALSLSYAYRIYARSFPEDAHTLRIEYCLPFSVL